MRPEIYRMQVRAIVEAAKAVKEKGHTPIVEQIPLVGRRELEETREEAEAIVREVLGENSGPDRHHDRVATRLHHGRDSWPG